MEKICSKNMEWISELGIVNLNKNKNSNSESDKKNTTKESTTTNCFLCGSKFSFFARPNNCNLCPNLFCNSCITKLQTKIKLCKNCLKLCQDFNKTIEENLIKITEKSIRYVEMTESYFCKNFDDYQISLKNFITSENIICEKKLLMNANDLYELIIKTLINYVLKLNFNDENIVSEWKNIIYILIKETISNLRPSSKYLNDSLDINNYIKIKIIPYKDNSKCQVIQGYVFHNKKKYKNVKDNIYNPKILLLNEELQDNGEKTEEENNSNNKENSQDTEYLNNLIENKIDIIKPDMIIIGKNFLQENLDLIINNNNLNNISIIYDINDNIIKKLSRCIQTLIFPSFKLIGSNNILGSCKRFYIEKYSNNNINYNSEKFLENNIQIEEENIKKEKDEIINKNNEKENDLFIFDGCNRLLFNTIILSGNNMIILKKIKKIMKQLLLPSIRDLFLQKYVQYTLNMKINPVPQESEIEIDFIEELLDESHEISPIKNDSSSFNIIFNRNIERKKRLNKRLSTENEKQKPDIDKLFYEGFDISIIENKEDFNIYSLTSLTSSQKNKIDNLNDEKDEDFSEKEIHNIVNKYCEDPKEISFSFFNGDIKYDQSLGRFIFDLCKKANLLCPTCNLEYKKHTLYFFRSKGVLKLWMISGNENNLDKIVNYLYKLTKIDYSKILIYKNDNNSISEIINSDIYTYGYCNICKEIVTPLFKVGNEVFNYSSSKFIRFMLENHLSTNQKRNYIYNISDICNGNCEHQINKDISRIFVTRFGSWIFEYNDIIKHYISPMNLNINNSFLKNILFKKYEDEGYSNSANIINLIQNALLNQKNFFKKLLEDEKLNIFKEYINSIIEIIESLYKFNEEYMVDTINKFLKIDMDKYNNNYSILIANIKKIYIKIVKIKLILNEIERAKIKINIISEILNNEIPLTLEENKKLYESQKKEKNTNSKNKLISGINFRKDISFRNIITFINYSDDQHDYYSCEFIKDDISSFISNVLSSNDYIKFMELKEGLNLTSIKRKETSNELIEEIISHNLSQKKRFSSLKKIKEKTNFFDEIDKGISRKKSFDDDKNTNDVFDTLLIFDHSKQFFYVEKEEEAYSNETIKKILEEELTNGEKDHKICYLSNNYLYSIYKKSYSEEDELKKLKNDYIIIDKNNVNDENGDNNISEVNSNNIENINNTNKSENDRISFLKNNLKIEDKDVFLYFRELETLINDSNIKFKELREKLINIIKTKIEEEKIKNESNNNSKISKETEEVIERKENIENNEKGNIDIKEKNDEKNDNNKDKDINYEKIIINEKDDNIKKRDENDKNKEEINNKENIGNNEAKEFNEDKKGDEIYKNKENKNIKDINNKNENINDVNNEDKNENDKIKKEKEDLEKIPIFPIVPEFEQIANSKIHLFHEEKLIKHFLKEQKKIEIIIYFAKQFEALRIVYCSSIEDLLLSLSKSTEWIDNSGGKSNAIFYKTCDERFVLKNINENEFNMFIDNGIEYFQYMSQFLFHKMPSALAKILGAFKITVQEKNKEKKYFIILMENIYYGMISKTNPTFNSPESNIRAYDLKGSNVNRYINKNMRKPGQVLLDTNFLVDFNKEPVFIESNVNDRLKLALYNDTTYLKKLGVVDYSLLLIFNDIGKEKRKKIEEKNFGNANESNNTFPDKENNYRLIKLGIIDYTRKYTWDKQLEFYGKSILYGENPTIVDPNVYSERFYKKITKYFVGV